MSPGSFENLEAFSGTSLPFPDSLASSICLRRGYLWEQYLFLTWYLLHHAVHVEEGIWLQGLLLFIFHCFHHSSSNQLFWLSGTQTLTPWDTLTWWRDGFQRRKSNSCGLLPPGGFPGTRQIQQVYRYLCLAMAGGSGPEASSSCCSLLSCQYLCSWMWDKGREFLSLFTPWFPEGWWINCIFHSYCSCFSPFHMFTGLFPLRYKLGHIMKPFVLYMMVEIAGRVAVSNTALSPQDAKHTKRKLVFSNELWFVYFKYKKGVFKNNDNRNLHYNCGPLRRYYLWALIIIIIIIK